MRPSASWHLDLAAARRSRRAQRRRHSGLPHRVPNPMALNCLPWKSIQNKAQYIKTTNLKKSRIFSPTFRTLTPDKRGAAAIGGAEEIQEKIPSPNPLIWKTSQGLDGTFLGFICRRYVTARRPPATTEPEAVGTGTLKSAGWIPHYMASSGKWASVSRRACPFVRRGAQEGREDSPDRP